MFFPNPDSGFQIQQLIPTLNFIGTVQRSLTT